MTSPAKVTVHARRYPPGTRGRVSTGESRSALSRARRANATSYRRPFLLNDFISLPWTASA
ncbi:hypothetical protein Ppa06_43220 [Planomonospora parontospora subsp. parontospora]|uniref:Uncharacterized protein n=2 Tax=Planomonospora parontospora TaxID=58119 RepID=A0AA37BK18_9ACTN|nr:hypothetical protein GCM10010126_49070 [Planomonospora parontospora]GII10524.1 hypothetical protein Ppa06_43220 [Planomonospora parontospora subsp. parontospora]